MRTREKTKPVEDIILYEPEGEIIYKKEMVQAIKNTVAKKATPAELYMFLTVAHRYNLDPFLKEIWFIKYERRGGVETRIETSRDGYLKIAQSRPEFKSVQGFVVHENDTFSMKIEDGEVSNIVHEFKAQDRGKILGAWAVAKAEGRENVYAYVPFSEYDKSSTSKGKENTWNTNPSAMILKVAEVFVLKRQFGISGLVTDVEMGTDAEKITAEKRVFNRKRLQPAKEHIDIEHTVKSENKPKKEEVREDEGKTKITNYDPDEMPETEEEYLKNTEEHLRNQGVNTEFETLGG